jgi:hypothetical protein
VTEVKVGGPARVAQMASFFALAASCVAFAVFFGESAAHSFAALIAWILGWGLSLAGIADWERFCGRPPFGAASDNQPAWRRGELTALAVVLVAATLLRTVAIERLPVALHNDEMNCLLQAQRFLVGHLSVFTTSWYECPNLGFFMTSIPLRFIAPDLLALRLGTAGLGVLSLLAAYLLVRHLFGIRPAMLLLLLTTPFHWHLHFSRAGFHYMQAASISTVALLLFTVALDRRSPVIFGIAGVVTGIACQTYYAAWLTPIILCTWVVAMWLADRRHGALALRGLAVTTFLFLITMAPLAAHYIRETHTLTSRPTTVFLLSNENTAHVNDAYGTSEPIRLLVKNGTRLAGLFIGTNGDTSVQYGLQDQFIDPYLMPLFLAGLVYAFVLIRRPGGQLLWIMFLETLIAGGLLTVDAPFSPRLIGVTPIILLFPALVLDRILRIRWIASSSRLLAAIIVAIGGVVAMSAWWNLETTFVRYPGYTGYEARDYIVRTAYELRTVKTIVVVDMNEHFDHQAFRALLPGIRGIRLSSRTLDRTRLEKTVRSFGPDTLVVTPTWGSDAVGLCRRLGATTKGIDHFSRGNGGIEWCLLE